MRLLVLSPRMLTEEKDDAKLKEESYWSLTVIVLPMETMQNFKRTKNRYVITQWKLYKKCVLCRVVP